jgi:nucleoside-diphosphate-sugar epimerase
MLAQKSPKLSSGARMVDWVYVDDTIDALMLTGLASGIEGKTLEIGSGELVSINEIARKVQRLIPESPPPRWEQSHSTGVCVPRIWMLPLGTSNGLPRRPWTPDFERLYGGIQAVLRSRRLPRDRRQPDGEAVPTPRD